MRTLVYNKFFFEIRTTDLVEIFNDVENADDMIRHDTTIVALKLDGELPRSSFSRCARAIADRSAIHEGSRLLSLTIEGGRGSENAAKDVNWEEDTAWLVQRGFIKGLDISKHSIGGRQVLERICDGVSLSSTLVSLKMSNCCLRDVDIARLANALSSNTSLRNLSLASNPFGKPGYSHLASLLIQNTTLESLAISAYCNSGVEKVGKALEENSTLMKLDLRIGCGCAQCQEMGNRSRDEMCIVESLRVSVNLHPKFVFVGFPLAAYFADENAKKFDGAISRPGYFTSAFDKEGTGEDRKVSNQEMLKRFRERHEARRLAFAMGMHLRLGIESPILDLNQDMAQRLAWTS